MKGSTKAIILIAVSFEAAIVIMTFVNIVLMNGFSIRQWLSVLPYGMFLTLVPIGVAALTVFYHENRNN